MGLFTGHSHKSLSWPKSFRRFFKPSLDILRQPGTIHSQVLELIRLQIRFEMWKSFSLRAARLGKDKRNIRRHNTPITFSGRALVFVQHVLGKIRETLDDTIRRSLSVEEL
ncbi:hypothetical protein RRG08_059399 [Elysia crispata]|uniref:Uncharacterized protein n=1 Tax=Elysia crispata TaxID=231223 RepID=A0AAE1DUY0_9GAST|nr:hypothetical protein RRG08_059399 [Elysia crispata]